MNTHRHPGRHSAEPILDRLAALYGISPGFMDARGQPVVTSPETRKLLLRSMGVAAETDTEAAEALRQAEDAALDETLSPVLVVRTTGGTCKIPVMLPAGTTSVDWQATLENGSILTGTATGRQLLRGRKRVQAGSAGERRYLRLSGLPEGYHRLALPGLGAETELILTSGRCWLPDQAKDGLWGIAVQLYLLRSERDWGIGDLGDLKRLVREAGRRGCAVIGLNPLHQMFLDDPEQASPYSPASRLFLNVLYIDVPAVPEFESSGEARRLVQSPRFQEALQQSREARLVDYAGVTLLKLEVLRILYRSFLEQVQPDRRQAFLTFREQGGVKLERSCLFQVLRQTLSAQDPSLADWHNWPEELQDPASTSTSQFADEYREELDFLVWLQFVADDQLQQVVASAQEGGMAIGLYRDLAVGSDSAGAETWVDSEAFLGRARVGAPPDIFNPAGQNWGLPPFDPQALRRDAYRSFVDLIRANMRHAGGLRIDHVMGLQRLYCIPEGKSAAEGAYLSYPIDDLIGILALESQRQRCLVVGEDLGTVPDGFREKLAAANILSYRVLFFEQDSGTGVYVPPDSYPEQALAVTGSHDLPTLLAWWEGKDIGLKESLDLYPDAEEAHSQHLRRDRDRDCILAAFRREGVLGGTGEITAFEFAEAAHAYLAKTRSALVMTQLDDMTGESDPVNVPGTSIEHPNWRRKYALTVEQLETDERAWTLVAPLARTPRSRFRRNVAGQHAPAGL